MVCYSYGATIGFHLCHQLELLGYQGKVVLIDGSPFMMKKIFEQRFTIADEIALQMTVITSTIGLYATINLADYAEELSNPSLDYAGRVEIMIKHSPKVIPHSKEHQKNVCVAIYDRVKVIVSYNPSFEKSLKSTMLLIKPSEITVQNIDEDYEISKLLAEGNEPAIVYVNESDHTNILDQDQCAQFVKDFLGDQ